LPSELPDQTAVLRAEQLATDIEVSTLIAPRKPVASSPDDDQTGVRALLSALPEPDPIPAYLVERISASLAAEEAQRAVVTSGASVTPLLATSRRRRGRLLFSIAGAAAAVVMIATLGNNLLRDNQSGGVTSAASSALASAARESSGQASTSSDDKAVSGNTLVPAATPASIRIRVSSVRYTQATFVAQARKLRDVTFDSPQPMATDSSALGPIGTTSGLTDCLSAIGAGGAQLVQADLSFYQGQPAVIIVATTDGVPTAYAAGRGCSRADASLLHQGVVLP
jgi:hypothetical protein